MSKKKRSKNTGKKIQKKAARQGGQIADSLLAGAMAMFSCIWLLLILVIMPFYNQQGYAHIGSDKSYLLRMSGKRMGMLLLPVFCAWLVCRAATVFRERRLAKEALLQKKDLRIFSAVDVFAALYAFSVLISYACSGYRETALWGTKGWYMGLIPQLILVISYFVLSRFEFVQLGRWLLLPCFPVSAVTFVLGYLNRFDVWPLEMESSGLPEYISTIGNINWYCSYVVIVLFVAIGLFWADEGQKRSRSIFWMLYIGLGFGALITQGSESGIFAMLCVLLFLFIRSAFDADIRQGMLHMMRLWQIIMLLAGAGVFTWVVCMLCPGRMNYSSEWGGIFYSPFSVLLLLAAGCGLLYTRHLTGKGKDDHRGQKVWKGLAAVSGAVALLGTVTCVLLIVINTRYPGRIGFLSGHRLFTFDYEWGSRRGATWMLGIRCFADQDPLHKLVGVGPDCMTEYLYSDEGIARGLEAIATSVFEGRRLTNAHCELLTILINTGLLGAISYAGFLAAFLKKGLGAAGKHRYAVACALGVLAYFCNGLWSFQQSMGAATLFVMLGLGMYYLKHEPET